MMNYIKYIRNSFSPLRLNNELSLKDQRTSHPLELFFDLVFVVALGKVSHTFLDPSVKSLLMAVILFIAIYQIWKNITKFNVYFFQHSLISSFLFVIVMIPIFLITSMAKYTGIYNIYLLIILFSCSRLILSFAWYQLVYRNDLISNKYINKISKSYSIIFLCSSLFLLLGLLNYKYFYLILMISIILELISTYTMHYKVSQLELQIPMVDLDLLQERRVLFVILIWGEALVTAGSMFSNYENISQAVSMNLALFLIISFFFLRAVTAFGDAYNIKKMKFFLIELTDYIFPLLSLSLFVSVAGIAAASKINELSRWIVIFDLMYVNTSHYLGNRKDTKQGNLTKSLTEFIKLDNILLLLQAIITIILIFINSTTIFVYLILIIFILHFLAVPIRHQKTEYF